MSASTSFKSKETLPLDLASGISREYLLHHRICPVGYTEGGTLRLAISDRTMVDGLDEIAIAYALPIVTQKTSDDEIDRFIEHLVARSEHAIEIERGDAMGESLTTDVRDLANQPPVIRYVNLLIRDAHDARASDIHLESTGSGLLVRFRVDGVLVTAPQPPSDLQQAIISRVKLLAELDIAERRRAQDGRIRVRLEDRELDLRVSTVPTIFGESVVLRLLARGGRPVTLDELGMSEDVRMAVGVLARKPHGLVLVTGPTGSGKTTTLYAALALRNAGVEKIVTVEDPIEYQLEGVTQVPVHRASGMTFASALRSILRQDPDVIMVGEMRDAETAEVAVQAALTGHLVFSTLHTNDALGAIPRLLDLGVPPYLVAATLEGVLAQRLVRRICDSCRTVYSPPAEMVDRLGFDDPARARGCFTHGAGCAVCGGTGYKGRVGLYELLLFTESIRTAVSRKVDPDELLSLTDKTGMRTLRRDGWEKICSGLTTVEEAARVVQHAT